MEHATEFFDKAGKRIYIGDILQTQLGTFAKKRGGPTHSRVIRFGTDVQLIDANIQETKHGGWNLTESIAKRSVIVDRAIFR